MEEHSFFGDTDTAQAPNLTPPLDGLRLGPHPDLTTPSCGVYSANMDSTLGLDNVIDECNIGENQGPRNTRRFTGLGHINLPNEGFEQHANFHPRVSPLFGSCTNCARITHVDFGESSWSSSKCFTLGSTYNLGVNNMLTSNGGWDVPNVPIEANSISQSAATVSDTSAQELLRGCSDDIEYWDRKGPKIGARFSRETTRILRDWVSAHCSHPYPSEEDKEYLMRVTSLTKPQVTNWVTNARRRGKICPPGSPSLKARKLSNSMDISGGMHLRQEASPDDEQAPAPAICEAGSLYSSKPSTLCDLPYSDGDFGSPLHNISSVGSSATSPSSSNLLFSHPLGSLGSSKERRCSREISNCDLSRQVPTAQHMYQCTFCTKTFKAKHDWQRHELMHFSPEKWICAPNGPTYTSHGHVTCVFCGLQNPSARHINDQHNYLSCAERSLTKRSFYRKDHLCQHLKGVHGIRFQSPIMDTWKVSIAELLSRCGFCGLVMKSWLSRAEHLAEHFKLGKTMADWKGDWGFDPEILGFINNAIPPDLSLRPRVRRRLFPPNQVSRLPNSLPKIPASTSDADFTEIEKEASRLSAKSDCHRPSNQLEGINLDLDHSDIAQWIRTPPEQAEPAYPSPQIVHHNLCTTSEISPSNDTESKISYLTRHLSRFITRSISTNNPTRHIPTDAEIQHHARWVLYDDDAPWKRTPADDVEWLQRLKSECYRLRENED